QAHRPGDKDIAESLPLDLFHCLIEFWAQRCIPAVRIAELTPCRRVVALEELDPVDARGREFRITVRSQLLDEQDAAFGAAAEPLRLDDLSQHPGVELSNPFADKSTHLADADIDGIDVVQETHRGHEPAAVFAQFLIRTAPGVDLEMLEHLEQLLLRD